MVFEWSIVFLTLATDLDALSQSIEEYSLPKCNFLLCFHKTGEKKEGQLEVWLQHDGK